jgi:hypothetical protein
MRFPSGEYAPEPASGIGSGTAEPPAAERCRAVFARGPTSCGCRGTGSALRLSSTVDLIVVAPALGARRAGGIPGELLRRAAGGRTTYTCSSPSYWPVNAIRCPCGENFAKTSTPGCVVKRVAFPPRRARCPEIAAVA